MISTRAARASAGIEVVDDSYASAGIEVVDDSYASAGIEVVDDSYASAGIEVVRRGGEGYPPELAADPEAPPVLFVRRNPDVCLTALPVPRVAIVGTRRSTGYGRDVATELGRGLSTAGVCVVSGLAYGIDAAAHQGVLSAEGAPPIGVVGSGLDVVYPSSSGELWRQVAERGALLSPFPPKSPPLGWHFPARNGIIAALAHVLVVVESSRKGGAMHTVEAANTRGAEVMAVPGSVRSKASEGCNALLYEGCSVVRDVPDVLTALSLRGFHVELPTAGGTKKVSGAVSRPDTHSLPAARRQVLDVLGWEPMPTGRIVEKCADLSVGAVTCALNALEETGLARSGPGWWERCG